MNESTESRSAGATAEPPLGRADRSDRAGESWLDHPVLAYGPRKGGTTLFQNLLDGADELFTYPAELKLKYFVNRPWGEPDDVALYIEISKVPTIEAPRLSREDYAAAWQRFAAQERGVSLKELILQDIHHVMQSIDPAPAQPAAWCAKEVGGQTDDILALWFELFPKAKVLFLLRDPRMVVRAILNERRRSGRRLTAGEIARETRASFRVVAAQARHLGDPRIAALCYEDLVEDTDAEMRRVADFIGIPYSDRLTRPTLLGEPVVVATSSRQTTQVFSSTGSWTEGLPLRERLIVRLVAACNALRPKYRVNYPALRRRVSRIANEDGA